MARKNKYQTDLTDDIRRRISALSPAKRKLLEKKLLEATSQKKIKEESIVEPEGDKPVPLSFSQYRLWLAEQFDSEIPVNNNPFGFKLVGDLDNTILKMTLAEIIKRHDSLHSRIVLDGGQPYQVIGESIYPDLTNRDISTLDDKYRQKEIQKIISSESGKPFDIYNDLLIRFCLISLGSTEYILLVVAHHLVMDGWSKSLFHKEMCQIYRALASGKTQSLPDIGITYRDHSLRVHSNFFDNKWRHQKEYWRRQLQQSPILAFPCDFPRPPIPDYKGRRLSFSLSRKMTTALARLNHSQNTTDFITLLSAFFILLARYSGQQDIVIGTHVSGRNQLDTENTIGCFINNLPLRINLDGEPDFLTMQQRVRRCTLDALQHQDYPFEKMFEDTDQERDPSRYPIFQAVFHQRNFPEYSSDGGPVEFLHYPLEPQVSRFDFAMEIVKKSDQIAMALDYNTALFSSRTIKRVIKHYLNLVRSALGSPTTNVFKIPLLTSFDRNRVFNHWNGLRATYPKKCVHQLFEEQARKYPQKTAVAFYRQELTYAQLNQRATRVSHSLFDEGIGSNQRVAICIDRSLDFIVAMLGVLKTGAAYVPLDPEYPAARLSFMAEDSGARVILCQEKYRSYFQGCDASILTVDTLTDGTAAKSGAVPVINSNIEDLAYVIYTSGSSGTPKGVQISQRNLLAFLYGFRQVTRTTNDRVGTSVTTFNFDVSVEEIFSCLCFGGTLHIIRPEDGVNGGFMAEYLLRNGITHTYILPFTLPDLAERLKKETKGLALKCLITGLSPKKQAILQQFREMYPELLILNAYGPTEVTYGSTAYEFKHAWNPDQEVLIGKSFPNYDTYVVDRHYQPVPIGVIGEIVIGGEAVSRGYMNQQELTDQKFISVSLGKGRKDRIYLSGDLGRYRDDGNIEFIGRADKQVKIRGFRIELGEIERAISRYPGIQQAVVTASVNRLLVAYLKTENRESFNQNRLRSFLTEKLPRNMIPSAFVLLDEFPLMVNGKIDIQALPTPETKPFEPATIVNKPRSDLEKKLALIWSDIFGIKNIDINADFFEMGGDSLLATQVITRLRSSFQLCLSLRDLFEQTTIKQLASFLSARKPEVVELTRRIIGSGDRDEGEI